MDRAAAVRGRSWPSGRVGHAVAAGVAALALGACAVRQTVVLVADPDGRVGQVEVATAGGTRLLTRPGEMTQVAGASAPPSPVTTADPAYLASTFGEVLAAEPPPPERFILYFETGTTALVPGSGPALAAITAAARRRTAVSVSVSGHTDATGTDPVNDRLALARARRVEALLVEGGIAPALLSISSHGKGNPAVPTPDGVAEPRNRRVEVILR